MTDKIVKQLESERCTSEVNDDDEGIKPCSISDSNKIIHILNISNAST